MYLGSSVHRRPPFWKDFQPPGGVLGAIGGLLARFGGLLSLELLSPLGGVLEAILGVLEAMMIPDSAKIAQKPKKEPKISKTTMEMNDFGR